MSASQGIRCREIRSSDLPGVLDLLSVGFPERSRTQLSLVLDRLAGHAPPSGFPQFGYVLEVDGRPVGIILVIFSAVTVQGETRIRGNVASWYVDPAYRGYASLLTSHALAHKNATFINITPARHTWPILEAQGYKPLWKGQFFAVASLARSHARVHVHMATPKLLVKSDLSPSEIDLLRDHQQYGCLTILCESNGQWSPFVFAPRWTRWKILPLPYALLVYCRGIDDFVRFAGPIGRFLLRRGIPLVMTDANGPVNGLRGRYVEWWPKFYKGATPPRQGDLSYTEGVMFEWERRP